MSRPIAFCAYVNAGELGGQAPDNRAVLPAFAQLVGRAPAGVRWYEFRDQCPGFPLAKCQDVQAFGAVPIVAFRQNAMATKDVAAGGDDAYYAAFASAAAAWGHPFYLCYDWEMNIGLQASPADWVGMWRHLHDVFRAAGAANVRWVWNPNVEYWGTTDIALLWPGEPYVDWVALDGYNWGHIDQWHWWSTFTQVFGASYARLQAIAPGKPVLVGETACADNGGDKGAWIRSALEVEIPQSFPAICALTWFNQDKEQDWRLNSSPAALAGAVGALAATYQPAAITPPPAPLYGGSLG